jgi:hypothetical protein
MNTPMNQEAFAWSAKEGFWYRHPLFAWTLLLAVFGTLYAFTAPYLLGNADEHAAGSLVFLLTARVFLTLKKNERAKRRLRPSPFFFWM